ncbi:MAG TPA: response regulator [Vicinamibacterales bacterium]|jgi:CheY-like chemotaxis protein/HPt (histidine-containing phosphotransfer) domain-containing protein|nr:response regulator [Vicinamibacterales bacterium]
MAHKTAETTITVLLVDDQRFVGAALGQLLAGEPDIVLHCCREAADAVAQANAVHPSLILQDLLLPDVDGLTMLGRFRDNPATALTPVVVLSASDDAKTRAKAMAAGAVDYLVKLPTRAALVDCIRRHAGAPVITPAAMPTRAADETLGLGVLDELKEGGNTLPAFALFLIDQYVEEAATQVEMLKDARARHDAGALTATAHILKGSSATMGAKRLAALCADMERRSAAGSDDVITPDMMADVDLEFVRVRAALAIERLSVAS